MIVKHLVIDVKDNVAVALQSLKADESIVINDSEFLLHDAIAEKHKFSLKELKTDQEIVMYGVVVGKATEDIGKGCLLTTENIHHATSEVNAQRFISTWNKPDVTGLSDTFEGFKRNDGKVGTANHWLVVPMVFCQNRNVRLMKESLLRELGYEINPLHSLVKDIHNAYQENGVDSLTEEKVSALNDFSSDDVNCSKTFPNVDGVKFLMHDGGCGGDRMDSYALVELLAGYIVHGNVAGATILSLGCEHAQADLLREAIHKLNPNFDKPLCFYSQQKEGSEKKLLEKALLGTFRGLVEANKCQREAIDVSALVVGVECGGSDGFSGISSNLAIGLMSDLMVGKGGSVILSEFPELCGVEQELVNRCVDEPTSEKFLTLMRAYEKQANIRGTSFSSNPSPGNIKDGLITDAIKSAGAVKKGGTSQIVDVLDYTEIHSKKGLTLLCTPGNDVESTTGLVGSGAHVVLFSTGLGTPTGNPIVPVIKVSSNTNLFNRMNDIIDIDAGPIIRGEVSPSDLARSMYEKCIQVVSGQSKTKAQILGQDDFLLWKRGISL